MVLGEGAGGGLWARARVRLEEGVRLEVGRDFRELVGVDGGGLVEGREEGRRL